MSEWIFTFGSGHAHPRTGERLENRFVAIEGTSEFARETMTRAFGRAWGSQYESREAAGVQKFELTELRIEPDQDVNELIAEQVEDLLRRLVGNEARRAVLLAVAEHYSIPLEAP